MNDNTPHNLIDEVVESFLSHEHFNPSHEEVFERICGEFFSGEHELPDRAIVDVWIATIKRTIANICDNREGGNYYRELAFEEYYRRLYSTR